MVFKLAPILFVFLGMQLHVCVVKGEIQPGLRVTVAESTLQDSEYTVLTIGMPLLLYDALILYQSWFVVHLSARLSRFLYSIQ